MESRERIQSRRYENVQYERTEAGVIVHDGVLCTCVESPEDIGTRFSATQRTEIRNIFNGKEKECKECGRLFTFSRDDSSFCSLKCQQKYYIEHRQRKKMPKTDPGGVCRQCGTPLTGQRRTYCSDKCAKEAKKANERSANIKPKKPKKLTKEQKEKRFQKNVAEAKKAGLSYGHYRALEAIEKYARIDHE